MLCVAFEFSGISIKCRARTHCSIEFLYMESIYVFIDASDGDRYKK